MTMKTDNAVANLVVAICEHCGGQSLIETAVPPELLEGICQDCQADSDSEKPLTFRRPLRDEIPLLATATPGDTSGPLIATQNEKPAIKAGIP
jgi:hypothetical protein